MFNSRTAISRVIIGRLLVVYNSKNLNCNGTLCVFFYDSKRSIGFLSVFLRLERKVFCHALRLVNDFLTLKSSF